MANDTTITLIGNLTDNPELRFTAGGAAVAKFRVASTPTFFDKTKQEWVDKEAMFLTCTAWRQLAENVAETLEKGARVIVSGRLGQRTFETKEGQKVTVTELEVDEVGPSLRYATAKVTRMAKGGGQAAGGGDEEWGSASKTRPAGQQAQPAAQTATPSAETQRSQQAAQPAAPSPDESW